MTAATRPRPATEAMLQKGLIAAVEALSARAYHTTYSVGSDRGFPDLTCALPDGRKLWFEVKGPNGRLSPAQVAWIEALNAGDTVAYVVWPDHQRMDSGGERWPSVPHRTYDEILRLLQTGDDL